LKGQVQLTFTSLPAGLPHGKAGRVRMLAVTSLKRSPVVPDLPTVAESGLPGFTTDQWYGLVGPAGLPPAIVTRLNREILASLQEPVVAEKLRGQGFDIVGSTPAQFRTHIQSELKKWRGVAERAGIKTN
jgi:tripartite-type tricarboxylate transporter receptor subunit TctC